MILCGVCKGEKTVPHDQRRRFVAGGQRVIVHPSVAGEFPSVCGACGGSGLDAKGVQAFAEVVTEVFDNPYASDEAHALRVERLRAIVRGETPKPR